MKEKKQIKRRLFLIKNCDKIPTPEPPAEPTPKVATEATPTYHKKSKLKLQREFMNEIVADEKDLNNEIIIRIHCFKRLN